MTIGPKKTFSMLVAIVLGEIITIGGTQSISFTIIGCVIAFVFGFILTPLLQFNSLYYRLILDRPGWSEKFNQRKPLIFIQFIGYMILATGVGEIIGGIFEKQFFNFFGIILVFVGLGIITGMYLTIALKNEKK